MRKGKLKLLVAVLSVFALFAVASCGAKTDETKSESETESTQEVSFTISFDTCGGTAIKSVSVKQGEKIEKPEDPTKITSTTSYEFVQWKNGDIVWNFETDVVNEDVTLTAEWKVVEEYTEEFLPS